MPLIIGAGIALVGAGISAFGGMKGAEAQKKAQKTQQALQSLQAQRERYNQIRQSRKARAEILQQGANVGAGESSSVQAGASGVMQQAYGNIQYINTQVAGGKELSREQQGMADAQGIQNLGSGISSIGMSIFGNHEEVGSIFGG